MAIIFVTLCVPQQTTYYFSCPQHYVTVLSPLQANLLFLLFLRFAAAVVVVWLLIAQVHLLAMASTAQTHHDNVESHLEMQQEWTVILVVLLHVVLTFPLLHW